MRQLLYMYSGFWILTQTIADARAAYDAIKRARATALPENNEYNKDARIESQFGRKYSKEYLIFNYFLHE